MCLPDLAASRPCLPADRIACRGAGRCDPYCPGSSSCPSQFWAPTSAPSDRRGSRLGRVGMATKSRTGDAPGAKVDPAAETMDRDPRCSTAPPPKGWVRMRSRRSVKNGVSGFEVDDPGKSGSSSNLSLGERLSASQRRQAQALRADWGIGRTRIAHRALARPMDCSAMAALPGIAMSLSLLPGPDVVPGVASTRGGV